MGTKLNVILHLCRPRLGPPCESRARGKDTLILPGENCDFVQQAGIEFPVLCRVSNDGVLTGKRMENDRHSSGFFAGKQEVLMRMSLLAQQIIEYARAMSKNCRRHSEALTETFERNFPVDMVPRRLGHRMLPLRRYCQRL